MNTTLEANGEVTRTGLIREFNTEKERYQRELQELKRWLESELGHIAKCPDEDYVKGFWCACTIPNNVQFNMFAAATIYGKMVHLKEMIQKVSK